MKKIFFIARNELYALFFSPIAWILMILFVVMTSSDYFPNFEYAVGQFERGGEALGRLQNLTMLLTSHPSLGYFYGVIKNLYVFLPLITMGLISRETSSGTIRLLYSSPVRIRELVLGKYLAIVCFTTCLVLLLGCIVTSLCVSIINPDYVLILASVFGIFMVLNTYAAIGLFISSLTTYQIVAALITFAVFALLSQVGTLWQDVDVVRNITYYMNIGQKTSNFVDGLLNLRDFSYFMLIIGIFLAFTVIKIKSGTESISKLKMVLRYAVVIAIVAIVGYVTSRPQVNLYYDASREKIRTITKPTQAMLAKVNQAELEVTAYVNLMHYGISMMGPAQQNHVVDRIFEDYIRFKHDIHVNFVYYYNADSTDWHFRANPGKTLKELAEKEAATYRLGFDKFKSPDEIRKIVDIDAEENRCFFVVKYKGRKAILRTFDDPYFFPMENEFSASLNRLIAIPPKIAFTCDEIERGPFSRRERDYRMIASNLGDRHSLINQGFDFDTLSLKRRPIPDSLAAVVVADPRTPISAENLQQLDTYIKNGGNMLILTEPDRSEITRPLLEKLGLRLHKGLLIQPSAIYSSDKTFTYLTEEAIHLSPGFTREISNYREYLADSVARIGLKGANAIDIDSASTFKVAPLLVTDARLSWNRTAAVDPDSLNLKLGSAAGDEHERFVTAVSLRKQHNNKEQRIIVVSDADFLTMFHLRGNEPEVFNWKFGFWCFSHFTYGEFPANTLRPRSIDNKFTIKVKDISAHRLIYFWIIPIILAVSCSVILIRRKRK